MARQNSDVEENPLMDAYLSLETEEEIIEDLYVLLS